MHYLDLEFPLCDRRFFSLYACVFMCVGGGGDKEREGEKEREAKRKAGERENVHMLMHALRDCDF